jgi:cell wall assembly regulator SMI1
MLESESSTRACRAQMDLTLALATRIKALLRVHDWSSGTELHGACLKCERIDATRWIWVVARAVHVTAEL